MHMSVTVRKSPGMRMIHHDFVISALSALKACFPTKSALAADRFP